MSKTSEKTRRVELEHLGCVGKNGEREIILWKCEQGLVIDVTDAKESSIRGETIDKSSEQYKKIKSLVDENIYKEFEPFESATFIEGDGVRTFIPLYQVFASLHDDGKYHIAYHLMINVARVLAQDVRARMQMALQDSIDIVSF